ncbi:hypothetical protein KKC08_02360 [Patescibacteria group bacterium]|nr:hypothetical protein [Patescibacteria group bacterium]MCG2702106.1 hypothetical protein [Candidatus Parcubacteria bacterium]MBU4265584.1 hypothetical protein [Patescibacteria group bacterium]MBU4390814.1 hypothetical protein [Patescibacteria group bacterium]MBU4396983.1 hypothetical protein [Patescibacteria group bacterium]
MGERSGVGVRKEKEVDAEGWVENYADWKEMRVDLKRRVVVLGYDPIWNKGQREDLHLADGHGMAFDVVVPIGFLGKEREEVLYGLAGLGREGEDEVFVFDRENWDEVGRGKKEEELMNVVYEKINSAEKSLGIHGWASLKEVWDLVFWKDFLRRDNKSGPRVAFLANFLVNNEGSGKGRDWVVDPHDDLAEQIRGFQRTVMGWDGPIYWVAHSTGAVGAKWAAVKTVSEGGDRNSAGETPDIRLVSLSPAYPAEANVFADIFLLRAGLGMAELIDRVLEGVTGEGLNGGGLSREVLRKMVELVAHPFCKYLLPDTPELHDVQAKVIARYIKPVVGVMRALKRQKEMTPEQMLILMKYIPMLYVRSVSDGIVDAELSARAVGALIEGAVEMADDEAVLLHPMSVVEQVGADHYGRAMKHGRDGTDGMGLDVEMTIATRRVGSIVTSWARVIDLVPKEKLADFTLSLYSMIETTMSEDHFKREEMWEKRAETLLSLAGYGGEFIENVLSRTGDNVGLRRCFKDMLVAYGKLSG